MVNTRRSELDIIQEILTRSKDGAKTTELLYNCNLSYTQCKSYISFLIKKRVLEEKSVKNGDGYSKMYVTTENGKKFLMDIEKVLTYLK